jgi:hypothetical protein
MAKVLASQILLPGATLSNRIIDRKDPAVIQLIAETKKRQAEAMQRKNVDRDRLKAVIRK